MATVGSFKKLGKRRQYKERSQPLYPLSSPSFPLSPPRSFSSHFFSSSSPPLSLSLKPKKPIPNLQLPTNIVSKQFVFPNAGLTLAAIQVGSALNSPGINGICSALTIFLVIMWLIMAVAHIQALWKGKIMWPGKDEDKDMQNLGWGKFSA